MENVETVIVPFHWLVLTIVYFITAAITSFDANLIRAVRHGDVPPDEPLLPQWVGFLYYVNWGILIALLWFHWKWGILVFVIKTILSFFGVMEIVGNILMAPLKWRRKPK